MALSSLLIAAGNKPLTSNNTGTMLQQSNQTMPVHMQAIVESTGQVVPPSSHTGAILDAVQNNSDSFSNYFESLAILFCVLAVLWLIVWFLRKRGGIFPSNSLPMFIESRLSMGPKKWLIVVNAYEKRFLIGVTEQSMSLITEIREEEAVQEIEKPFTPQSVPFLAEASEHETATKESMEKSFAALFEKSAEKSSTPEVS